MSELSQALLMFITFYKEVETLTNSKDKNNNVLRNEIIKSLKWHSLKKVKIDVPDLQIIED
jgi:hypothetical protein